MDLEPRGGTGAEVRAGVGPGRSGARPAGDLTVTSFRSRAHSSSLSDAVNVLTNIAWFLSLWSGLTRKAAVSVSSGPVITWVQKAPLCS